MEKKVKIVFIRHGKTAGNLEKRYIGKTDEPLCDAGIDELRNRKYPYVKKVVSSSMKRCVQTAEIIYPDVEILKCEKLCECDFGEFEGKNYKELTGNKYYTKWIESGGTLGFPGGETLEGFKSRCIEGFEESMNDINGDIAFVVHGGTIMSILEKFGQSKKGYYDYQVENGKGYICEFENNVFSSIEEIK